MTDAVSMTKMIPISGRTRIWPVISAVTASVAPRERAPESPMKIWAGWTLNHRKPSSAPMISAQQRQVRLRQRGVEQGDLSMYATKAIASVPPDSPSRPSVMLTPLAAAMIANAPNVT